MVPTRFTPQSEVQIRAEAERQLQQKAKQVQPGCGSAGCLAVVGFASLLVPYIGVFVFLVFFGAAVVTAISSFMPPKVNEQELAGLCYRLKGAVGGKCPVCESDIFIIPAVDTSIVSATCPVCRAPLHYDRSTHLVSPG